MKRVYIMIGLIIICTVLTGTYSLYESNVTTPVEMTPASFKIKVNDTLIGTDSNLEINSINWNESSNVKPGKAAPGLSGYFELVIDSSDVDLAFTYTISIDDTNFDKGNFKVKSVTGLEDMDLTNNIYSGLFTKENVKNNKVKTVRFDLEWENNEENNESDSEYIGKNVTIDIPITLHFEQYIE